MTYCRSAAEEKARGLFFEVALPQWRSRRSDHTLDVQALYLVGQVSEFVEDGVGVLAKLGNGVHARLFAVEENRRRQSL
jgi:hypothetical protein